MPGLACMPGGMWTTLGDIACMKSVRAASSWFIGVEGGTLGGASAAGVLGAAAGAEGKRKGDSSPPLLNPASTDEAPETTAALAP
eukprot:CAMPEP_0204536628 /NCGR_PEP_ID=MMETSP0661-20131031/14619_1 /ASSEMBLY_ACC=CAM_ASM_000606 /TAXON_ID=109239 /ORGANISM="Alexandrium margalefi, Strain AMGDE01CS-322" /LENGTH=84 /DNA_ID=CAMNT_0051543161 /DNA_START=195 /DNA_END=445 /DNA_ORIENTATION=+